MSCKMSDRYKAAIKMLIRYQPKEGVIMPPVYGPDLLEKSKDYVINSGHSVEELRKLNIIHIAGTKGKGSVSAMCERILRNYGLKTGLLTSPHLLECRERIMLNGQPLTQDQFADYFWECYTRYENAKISEEDIPNFYRFCTFLSFHVFLAKQVDVAIVEVGKGGAYDSTNILQNPVVCGITLLDLDHTDVLGDTIEEIAWHKAGICKPGSRVVVGHQEYPETLQVISKRAEELGVPSIETVPALEDYPGENIEIGIEGEHNRTNAALAVQISKAWLSKMGMWKHNKDELEDLPTVLNGPGVHHSQPFTLPQQFYDGLRLCVLPGRSHIDERPKNKVTFYMDVAHTPLSVKACAKWFREEAKKEVIKKGYSKVARILLFNFFGCRDRNGLLPPLTECEFDYAMFSPSFTGADATNTMEQSVQSSAEGQYEISKLNQQAWQELCKSEIKKPDQNAFTSTNIQETTKASAQNGYKMSETLVNQETAKTKYFTSVDQAIQWCCKGRGLTLNSTSPDKLTNVDITPTDLINADHVQILITGSVRLVGTAMFVIGINPYTNN